MWKKSKPLHPQYKITLDGDLADNDLHYSDEIQDLLLETYEEVSHGKSKTGAKIQKLIKKYPHIPAFHNYLSNHYKMTNQMDKAYAVNRKLLAKFPDYVFARINLAAEYLEKKKYDKIPEILGENLDLGDLYPERKVYHASEFDSFMFIVVSYLLEIGEPERAAEKLALLEIMHPDAQFLYPLLENLSEFIDFEEDDIFDPYRSYDQSIQTEHAPKLHHRELWQLYEHDLTIPRELLQEILNLPREPLVADLKAILWDSVCRLEALSEMIYQLEEWPDERLTFPLHALFLLTELKEKGALPLILDTFRQGYEYLDFWYADHIFETLWHPIYHLGGDQLEELKAFMLEPEVHYYGKTIICQSLKAISDHHPERKEEVLNWFESVLQSYLVQKDNPSLVNPDVVTTVVFELAKIPGNKRLHLLVRQFYNHELIDLDMIGPFEEFAQHSPSLQDSAFHPSPVHDSIFDHYHHITSTWHGYLPEEEQRARDEFWEKDLRDMNLHPNPDKVFDFPSNVTPIKNTKVGRNDPCPCGSGKKYKKCCWGKDH